MVGPAWALAGGAWLGLARLWLAGWARLCGPAWALADRAWLCLGGRWRQVNGTKMNPNYQQAFAQKIQAPPLHLRRRAPTRASDLL